MSDSINKVLSKFLEAIANEYRMDDASPFLKSLLGIYRKITDRKQKTNISTAKRY